MSIRILLVDDHTLFRSGLRLLLQRQPDFEIVAEAGDGVEGLKRAKELKPDVVLLDLNLPACPAWKRCSCWCRTCLPVRSSS